MSQRSLIRLIQRVGAVAVLLACVCACSSDDPVPYAELLVVGDQVTVRSFGVNADGVPTQLGSAMIPGIPGTYSRTGDVVTVTIAYHNVPDGSNVLLDFFPGTGGTATDGMYVATVVDDDNFTVVDSASGDITDGIVLRSPAVQYGATYSQTDITVTITLPGHNLESGDGVDLDFTSGAAVDTNKEIDAIVDEDTFTVVVEDPLTTSGNVDVVVGANYTIFGAAMHPNGRWLYVTSTYECYIGNPYCWGNDLITRFAID
jgi:archaellum component FlaF (FlaF/FlaG flagellin family)